MAAQPIELLGIARFKIHAGKFEEYKRLSEECMRIARAKDPGTLQYEVYTNEESLEAVVIERYKDSDSLIKHLENNQHVAKDIFLTGTVEGELLGYPNDQLREMLKGSPVRVLKPFLSM